MKKQKTRYCTHHINCDHKENCFDGEYCPVYNFNSECRTFTEAQSPKSKRNIFDDIWDNLETVEDIWKMF